MKGRQLGMRVTMGQRQEGFTLVELMIVLAVAAILLTIAAPSFSDVIDRARLRGAAGDIVSLLANARGASVQRNRNVAVAFAGSDPAWCVGANGAAEPGTVGDPIPAAAACDCAVPTGCMVGTQQLTVSSSSYNGVTMGARPTSITFDSRLGTLSTLAASTVVLTSPRGKYQLQVSIAPLGQASLCVPAGKPVVPGYQSCP
jgi:prepilin-type N-terminal cleavage/methylation domain-containing protein